MKLGWYYALGILQKETYGNTIRVMLLLSLDTGAEYVKCIFKESKNATICDLYYRDLDPDNFKAVRSIGRIYSKGKEAMARAFINALEKTETEFEQVVKDPIDFVKHNLEEIYLQLCQDERLKFVDIVIDK